MIKYLYCVISFDNTPQRNIKVTCFGTDFKAYLNAYSHISRECRNIIRNSNVNMEEKKKLIKEIEQANLHNGYDIEINNIRYSCYIEKHEINTDYWQFSDKYIYVAIATLKDRPETAPAYGFYYRKKDAEQDAKAEKDKDIKTEIIKVPIKKSYIKLVTKGGKM